MTEHADDARSRIAALHDEHAAKVYHYLLALLGSRAEADDALQAVFVELIRRSASLGRIESPRTYLLAMARHCAGRMRKQAQRRRVVETDAGTVRLLRANDPAQHDADETARLESAIMALPEEQREVLVLKVFEELTFREIGEVLNVSENTAASRYRYALDKLRERLGHLADS